MNIHKQGSTGWKDVEMKGAADVKIRILVGPDQGSDDIVMRHFKILPGGNTPEHTHPFEHVVKVEKGKGMVVDSSRTEHEVNEGDSLFVSPDEQHQFKNPFDSDFEFLCIIPGTS